MPEFLLELYMARSAGDTAERAVASAHSAAEALTREGTPVRCLSSIFVPEDETCFVLFEADSEATVRNAAARAALPFERITPASLPLKV
jgi:Protein of unknown function (DUF4242)